ncbi:putative reverse transcriptase domain-containing protein [Tanacetum coccineum]|uniref:Reverse transcriptase domain-containing protein n=1 Tax=Tanacetum coccineum TaxID=301880 RepID=A0ABQ4WI93_9ASTR
MIVDVPGTDDRDKAYLATIKTLNVALLPLEGVVEGYDYGKLINTNGKLDFEDVSFVKDFSISILFSVSQMCDKNEQFPDKEQYVQFHLVENIVTLVRIGLFDGKDCFGSSLWHSYFPQTPLLQIRLKEKKSREDETSFLDDLARLQRQEKEANEEAEALTRNHEQDTEKAVTQAEAAKTSSTNIISTVSTTAKASGTPIETQKPLVKDEEASDVDVHLYRSMIGSLMYVTASRPDIMFAVCACSRFQVTPKTSHLTAVRVSLVIFSCAHVSPVVSTTFVETVLGPSAMSKTYTMQGTNLANSSWQLVSCLKLLISTDLLFDDANGIDTLPNQAIFDAIQLMGYEGDLTVLTFNKALFSPQWRRKYQGNKDIKGNISAKKKNGLQIESVPKQGGRMQKGDGKAKENDQMKLVLLRKELVPNLKKLVPTDQNLVLTISKLVLMNKWKSNDDQVDASEEIFEGTEDQREGIEEKVESTAEQKESTEEQTKEEIATQASQTSSPTPTSVILGDDETICNIEAELWQARILAEKLPRGKKESEAGAKIHSVKGTTEWLTAQRWRHGFSGLRLRRAVRVPDQLIALVETELGWLKMIFMLEVGEPQDIKYPIELADERTSETNTVLRGCTLGLLGRPFDINLMPIDLGSFDIIIGTDWLAKNHAVIVYDEKIVRIPYGNKILIVQGDKCAKEKKSTLSIISCEKAQKYMEKGCQLFLAQVTVKENKDKSEEKRLEDVPTVRDFSEVFPEDLPGLPPTRQVEFQIDSRVTSALIYSECSRVISENLEGVTNLTYELRYSVELLKRVRAVRAVCCAEIESHSLCCPPLSQKSHGECELQTHDCNLEDGRYVMDYAVCKATIPGIRRNVVADVLSRKSRPKPAVRACYDNRFVNLPAAGSKAQNEVWVFVAFVLSAQEPSKRSSRIVLIKALAHSQSKATSTMVKAQEVWVFVLNSLTKLAQHVTSKNDMLAILRCP